MATYTVNLSPTLVNLATEGSLDTTVTNGNSLQRTMHGILVKNGSDYKMVGRLNDGGTFTDTVAAVGDYDNIDG